ncbi:uncharacterized protein LOC135083087, partial [Ostrinia nubilalis]|uniref:uncharacterized protein LOC135083087 n=1 Tax=Ostrinia nubilalis TaxID=29057 RepID=UPI0030826516
TLGCSGRGDCLNGTCLCEIRYAGDQCAAPNFSYHACIGGIFLVVAFICAVQLTICVVAEYRRLKAPTFLRACKVTTQKMLYFVAFLASLIRGAYFVSPSAFQEGWATSLLSAYYPLLMSGSSLIVCFWAEVFHLRDIRWERPRFISKTFLAFVTFNVISYSLLAAEVLTTNFADTSAEKKSFYQHVFNGFYAVLLFVVVIFFLIYGVEVYFKLRGEFLKETKVCTVISPRPGPSTADEGDDARDTLVTKQGVQTDLADNNGSVDPRSVNQSQLHQSRLGLLSQALMLILIAGFLASETLGEFWKTNIYNGSVDPRSVNQSQLHQSRLGLLSQALMLILIAGFLASETLGEFWKTKKFSNGDGVSVKLMMMMSIYNGSVDPRSVNQSQLHQSRLGLLSQALMLILIAGFLASETLGEFWKTNIYNGSVGPRSVNQSQLHQSRLGLLSQALMLILIAGFLASETLGEFWKTKVPVVSRNWHDVVFRLAEIGVALWFPCVLWNSMAPERLWLLNPRRLLSKQLDDATLNVETDSLVGSVGSARDCWICYDSGRDEPLIRPCRCTGDVSAVHHECLRRWLVESASTPDGLKCKVCNTPYIVQETNRVEWDRGFTCAHWLRTALAVACMCGAGAAAWLVAQLCASPVPRVLGAGAALLVCYVAHCCCYAAVRSVTAHSFTCAHWLRTALAVACMCGAGAAAWLVVQLCASPVPRVLGAGAALLVCYVAVRFLGMNTVSAYQRAKVSSLRILTEPSSEHSLATISQSVTVDIASKAALPQTLKTDEK